MLGLEPSVLITRILVLVIALTFHEFSHAWTANYLGDNTPRQDGRLTLNPLHHLDPIGSIALLISGFGWAKPVMVNPYALQRRTPAGLMWVSLAGPMSNFLMAILASIPLRMALFPVAYPTGYLPTPYSFTIEFIIINLSLMLFNLIPLAPLDGEKIFDYFIPIKWAKTLEQIRPYGPIILLALVFVLPMLGFDPISRIITPVLLRLMNLMGIPT